MNQQERDQLNQLLKPLVEFRLSNKDAEAESLIRDAVAHQPDAAYLLVQRVLLLEHALNGAKARIEELQKQLQSHQTGQASGSFLGSDPWAQPATASAGPVPGAGGYQQPRYAPPPAQAPYQPQAQASGGLFGGGSSFLGNIATTAAGIAAGGFLFQGIESLLGHHGSGFGGGGFGQSGFGGGQQAFGEEINETTVVNNYYGDDAGQQQLADNSDYASGNASFVSDDDDNFSDDSGSGDADWM